MVNRLLSLCTSISFKYSRHRESKGDPGNGITSYIITNYFNPWETEKSQGFPISGKRNEVSLHTLNSSKRADSIHESMAITC